MRNISSWFILGILIFAAGCQTNSETTESPQEIIPNPGGPLLSTTQPVSPTNSGIVTSPASDRFDTTPTKMPERVPPTDAFPPTTGEVPDELLDMIMADLVERTGVALNRILVIQAEATIWNDGSLGCPQPGVFYTQALVNGFWLILEADGKKYDYRASESGYFFICENEFPPVSPPGTPDS